MRTLADLLQMYSEAVARSAGCRELAELEAAIRDAAPPHVPRNPNTHLMRWQAETLTLSQHVLSCRRDLWNAREPAESLWERVDDGMQLGTARRLLRTARASLPTPYSRESLKAAIDEELQKLDGLDDLPAADLSPRDFLARLRKTVLEHMQPRVAGLPEHERERLLDEFEKDLRALLSMHNQKWQHVSRGLQEQKRVSRQRFVNALRALHMDPPRRHAPLAPILAQAKKQKRTLARLYHPDSHGGSEHTRAQYQAVIDAFLVVEQYIAENTTTAVPRPALRVINGGTK
jgi:hypothetical protein